MDDDDFNYEPEDLNSNDENEHKAKLYHFEDVPDVNIEEQKKISSFLDGLSDLITLQQRKLEKIKTLKKSMLEKMFPKEGAKE